MNQEEILKAIKEQTRAIERLIEAVERQSLCLEWYALQLRQVLGTDLEKVAPTTADMTDEEHIYVLVVDCQGNEYFRTRGPYSRAGEEALRMALSRLFFEMKA